MLNVAKDGHKKKGPNPCGFEPSFQSVAVSEGLTPALP